nr:reverse transcriptase domain-containing protein [Tanacetum cinerariifolium]
MDKAFEGQVGRNIEVYIDDLVVKSHTKAEMVRNIEETFRTLHKVNRKLNPKKCSFVLVEGVFLGYVVTPEGIKPCPDKTAAVRQLPSPRTIKKVQSLNGKLASLNRFLSRSAEKSLPLFQTLKKCIKKSNFHWTTKAEQAFQQLKQHLSELPLLVAPRPQEKLIMYLSSTHGAISAVLMTERGTTHTPIYFISRALQSPKLNYSPMEKLVLSLVIAAKRLRRYFQAHPLTVIPDQPIKQVMSRPDAVGRLQQWSIMLGEHNITYRPRTSVKGQILVDFLIEMPGDASQAVPAAATQEEPWTLFTDGSSCVDGSGAGLILTNPEGVEFTYALSVFKIETGRMKGAPECMRISGFMHGINNPELTKRLNEHVPKTMEEKMIATTAFIRGEAAAANKKKGHDAKGILAAEANKFQPPPPMVAPVEKRNSNKLCDFHNDKRHSTDECMQLKKQIEELVRAGNLSHLIKKSNKDGNSQKQERKRQQLKTSPRRSIWFDHGKEQLSK